MKSSLWVILGLYAAVALGTGIALVAFDHDSPLESSLDLSAVSAGAALAALGGGMITFTGFVMSVVLLVVQFGSSQFSPRFLRWFRDDPVMKHSLGTFIATFVFALTATALSGRGPENIVPYRALIGATVLTAASIAWFLALIARTSDNLRVAHVIQRIDSQARRVFDDVYPTTSTEVEAAQQAAASVDPNSAVQQVRNPDVGGVLVAVDRDELLRIAQRHNALSPAVNDPTTAVQCLHRIADVLRYAAAKHLSTGVVTDDRGAVRVLVPTPTWDDLIADLPVKRHPALARQLDLLEEAVGRAYPAEQRADALAADRQGLGMAIQTGESARGVS
ncbi:MAG: DUF2254 domain-containing protein [Candidatus Microthrix sp.]|nr:DUF2254 domain-containing protein [Candidatus Microthrix sp.]